MIKSINLEICNKCNLKCLHCFYKDKINKNEMSLEKINFIIKKLPHLDNVVITGGEPLLHSKIYQVLEFLHVKPGKGPAFIRTKIKNLRTGATIEKTFNTNIKLEKAIIDKQNAQYLYNNGDVYNFMNMETYEQIELTKDQLGEDSKYLKEGLNLDVTFYKGEVLSGSGG